MHLDHLKGVLCPSTAEKLQSSDTVCELLKVTSSELHSSPKGPYFRDRVPIGTFLTFWVPIYISGSLYSVLWLNSRKECQFSLHVCNNALCGYRE